MRSGSYELTAESQHRRPGHHRIGFSSIVERSTRSVTQPLVTSAVQPVALAATLKTVEPELKLPHARQWDTAFRIFDQLL